MNKKTCLFLFLSFIFGIGGGIFADQILWPYFIARPLFNKYNLDQPPVYVTERKEIIVRENAALESAIEKVAKTLVGVKAKTTSGSGLVVTNDGLIVTLSDLIPVGQAFKFYLGQDLQKFQVLKRDPKTGLALIKLETDNLSAAGFANSEDLALGQEIFMLSYRSGQQDLTMVSQGIVKFIGKDRIETDIFKTNNVQGSPIFDIGGKLIGIAVASNSDLVEVIPVSQIKNLIGL